MERRKEEPRIVVDTNILISALLKDHSISARLIKSKFFSIYFPEYGLKEMEKYRSYIIAKRKRNSQSLSLEFAERYIMEEIKIAPFDLYRQKTLMTQGSPGRIKMAPTHGAIFIPDKKCIRNNERD